MPQSKELPLVSIITPSFNQGAFLEETILSVLEQDYTNLEYLVVDGASTDGSVDIIRRYQDRITWWISEPDSGQAEAINKGLAHAKGEIVAWLNSDDTYRPGAIRAAVDALLQNPAAGFVYGNLDSIDQDGELFNTITYQQHDLADLLSFRIIGQPSVFMRKSALERAGELDPSYHFLLDHQLWLRIARSAELKYVPEVWAAARHHPGAKNVAQASGFSEETARILEWAQGESDLAEQIEANKNKVRAGAQRLIARYLLDAGEAWRALKAYGHAFLAGPSYTLKHAGRILFAILSLLGFGWLRRYTSNGVSNRRPILVSGLHRSGTTWIGRMLAFSGELAYVSEPLNVHHRPGVLSSPVKHWYSYISSQNEGEYLAAFEKTLQLRYGIWKELFSLRSLHDLLRMLRDAFIFGRGRITRQRVLLKDPFALFSVPWFAEGLDCEVVIAIRHPAAFVSSLKRLDWSFDFGDLLAQPALMRDYLEPFRSDMEKVPNDLIVQASLLWRINAHVLKQFQAKFPQFHILKHDELSREPLDSFRKLYSALGLRFTRSVEKEILLATGPGNPKRGSRKSIYNTRLDSAANLDNWKRRLSKTEIERIRELTKDEVAPFYGDEDWA